MAVKYCDLDLGTGLNDGSSEANAWQTLQAMADGHSQNGWANRCLIKGADTLSTPVDFDTNNGSTAIPIWYVGVDASWNEDGTRFVADGNATASVCIHVNGRTGLRFLNMEVTGSTGAGIQADTAMNYYFGLQNAYVHNNAGYGLEDGQNVDGTSRLQRNLIVNCRFENNLEGMIVPHYTGMFNCRFMHNTNNGIKYHATRHAVSYYSCIFHGNGLDGCDLSGLHNVVVNCVLDGNGSDGLFLRNYYNSIILGNRITNNGNYGLYSQYEQRAWSDYNYFEDNAVGNISHAAHIEGPNSIEDGGDTDNGYIDSANHDFGLRPDASLRDTLFDTGYGNGYQSAGLPAHPIGPGTHPSLIGGRQK